MSPCAERPDWRGACARRVWSSDAMVPLAKGSRFVEVGEAGGECGAHVDRAVSAH